MCLLAEDSHGVRTGHAYVRLQTGGADHEGAAGRHTHGRQALHTLVVNTSQGTSIVLDLGFLPHAWHRRPAPQHSRPPLLCAPDTRG